MATSDKKAFSIRIYVPTGDPDGLRIIERSNWIGKALVFPRALFPKIKARDELQQTGVYFLIGPRDDGKGDSLYVGEGDPVLNRLANHYATKDFWTRAVFFVTSGVGLNKAQVQYLESSLIDLGHRAKRSRLENKNAPKLPSLHEADRADMDVYLEHLLQILPLVGISAFERPRRVADDSADPQTLYLNARGVSAEGYETTEGFVVGAGSEAALEPVPSFGTRLPTYLNLREDLIGSEVLILSGKNFQFTQDYTFSSPSAAAAVVLGRSANGRTTWKDSNGRTLKEIQESEAQ